MNQNRKKKVRPKLSLTADPYYEAEKAKSMNKNNTTSAYGASSQGNTGWTTHRTTDGRAYYAHEELGTTWVKPTDLYEKNAPGKRKGNEVPNFIMSPNSRNRGLRRVGSFGMGKPMPASRGTPMPPNDGTFFEHVVTFSCDWFDWSILCTYIGCWIGIVFIFMSTLPKLVSAQNNAGTNNCLKCLGVLQKLVLYGWAIYPLGLFITFFDASVETALVREIIYNFGDLFNKIGFSLICFFCAKKLSKASV